MIKNAYVKVTYNFIKKNWLIYSLVFLTIIVSVFSVFVPFVTAKSQSINYKKVVENVYPRYPAASYDATSKEADLIAKNENVTESIKYEKFGFFISENSGVEYKLMGFSEKAIGENNYVLKSGRYPNKNDEIVIDKTYIKQEKDTKLGEYIGGLNNLPYKVNDSNELYSAKKKYRVVGIIEKNPEYTRALSKIKTKNRVEEQPMFWLYNTDKYPENSVNYTVLIKLKSGLDNLYGNCVKLGVDVAENPQKVVQNFEISRLNESIIGATRSRDDYILIFVSILFIASLFRLLNDTRLRNLGLLKTLGASSKDVCIALIFENLILGLISTIVGLCISYVTTYKLIGGTNVTDSAIDVALDTYKVYFNENDILLVLLVVFTPIIINLVSLIISYKKTQALELINEGRRGSNNTNLVKIKVKDFASKISIIGFINNFSNYILPIIIIVIIGSSIISVVGVEKILSTECSEYDIYESEYLGRNFLVKKDGFSVNNGISMDDIKQVDNYSGLTQNLNIYGYLVCDVGLVNESYLSNNAISQKKGEYEFDCTITGIDSTREKELEKMGIMGMDDIKKIKSNEVAYVLYNNLYYDNGTNKYQEFIKNIKQGENISLKIPYISEGIQKYKTIPVKILDIKNTKAFVEQTSAIDKTNVEFVFDLNKLKEITNVNDVSAVRFNVKSDKERKIVNDIFSSKYDIKDRDMNRIKEKELRDKTYFAKIKLRLAFYIILLLFSLTFTIRIIIAKKEKDFGILRMLGANKKLVSKILLLENMVFVVSSSLIAVALGVFRIYGYYKKTHDLDMYYKGVTHIKFVLPMTTILLFLISVFIVFFVIQRYSSRKLISTNVVINSKND
ncbi:MAG: FtsX-like permease family protein [Peptostreptococcus sp.]|uniref:FtsX-like permease family protein n=1 Tax=Peptostreptococcus TaxID=1257 RepID=UPI0029004E3E|nr:MULTISPECIES: FtsX-like permease family protein [Peptostreptococcus]MDU1175208.1 FtsX-like permease family protein [Peptostreptococcus anaerobius]MDU1233638.1 FtsX-like permease family protein [Peptostreptococcus anaerobius]MDU1265038.1 FtsX-like permease family protein [Peptostreptococcus sp.]